MQSRAVERTQRRLQSLLWHIKASDGCSARLSLHWRRRRRKAVAQSLVFRPSLKAGRDGSFQAAKQQSHPAHPRVGGPQALLGAAVSGNVLPSSSLHAWLQSPRNTFNCAHTGRTTAKSTHPIPPSGHPSLLWLDLLRHIEPSAALNATACQEARRTRSISQQLARPRRSWQADHQAEERKHSQRPSAQSQWPANHLLPSHFANKLSHRRRSPF